MKEVATIILAGGKGTRLYPLTQQCAKPVVTFGGRIKLIDIPIHHSLKAGIEDIYVLTQHLSKTIQQHLQKQHPEVQLLAADTLGKTYKGTADAVRKTLDYYKDYEYILILSGDQIYEIDFHEFLEFGVKTDADAVIATLPVSVKDAKRLGILKAAANDQIIDFIEKPTKLDVVHSFIQPNLEKEKPLLGSMGIYLFKTKALIDLLETNEEEDFGKHLIPKLIKNQATYAYIHQGYWEDIGTIASYHQANLDLTKSSKHLKNQPLFRAGFPLSAPLISKTKLKNSIICEGTEIDAKEIYSSIIGSGCQIARGSILENCVLCGKQSPTDLGGMIGQNCQIKNAIIDTNVVIGNSVHLLNKNGLEQYEDENIVIKDSVIIVKANSKIPDGFTL